MKKRLCSKGDDFYTTNIIFVGFKLFLLDTGLRDMKEVVVEK